VGPQLQVGSIQGGYQFCIWCNKGYLHTLPQLYIYIYKFLPQTGYAASSNVHAWFVFNVALWSSIFGCLFKSLATVWGPPIPWFVACMVHVAVNCACVSLSLVWPDRHVKHTPSSGPNSSIGLLWPGCLMQLGFTLPWTTTVCDSMSSSLESDEREGWPMQRDAAVASPVSVYLTWMPVISLSSEESSFAKSFHVTFRFCPHARSCTVFMAPMQPSSSDDTTFNPNHSSSNYNT
jgi:hypothetical protein